MTAGCVVLAMKKEAFATAFCISTDATGVAIQPEPSATFYTPPGAATRPRPFAISTTT